MNLGIQQGQQITRLGWDQRNNALGFAHGE
jgi:hypothetical protein